MNNKTTSKIRLFLDIFSKEENLTSMALSYYPEGISGEESNCYKTVNTFLNLDNVHTNGIFEIGATLDTNPIGTNLVEFLNFNFDKFKDFFIFYVKYFELFYSSMDADLACKLESSLTCQQYTTTISIAKNFYKSHKNMLKKYQKTLKDAVTCIYNLKNDTKLEELNFKQRFFIFQHFNDTNFKLFDDVEYNHNFSFTYPKDFYKNVKHTKNNYIDKMKKFDPNGNKLTVGNYYESSNIFAIFYITLFHLTSITDTYIKKCKNCDKYFLTSKCNTVYCENIFTDNQTCRDLGKQLTQKKKEEKESIYGKYRKIYARKAMLLKRNPDIYSKEDYENWRNTAKNFLNDIKNNKCTYEEFDKWLEKYK